MWSTTARTVNRNTECWNTKSIMRYGWWQNTYGNTRRRLEEWRICPQRLSTSSLSVTIPRGIARTNRHMNGLAASDTSMVSRFRRFKRSQDTGSGCMTLKEGSIKITWNFFYWYCSAMFHRPGDWYKKACVRVNFDDNCKEAVKFAHQRRMFMFHLLELHVLPLLRIGNNLEDKTPNWSDKQNWFAGFTFTNLP